MRNQSHDAGKEGIRCLLAVQHEDIRPWNEISGVLTSRLRELDTTPKRQEMHACIWQTDRALSQHGSRVREKELTSSVYHGPFLEELDRLHLRNSTFFLSSSDRRTSWSIKVNNADAEVLLNVALRNGGHRSQSIPTRKPSMK